MNDLDDLNSGPIPEHWTGADAFLVVTFLADVIDAIWQTHGRVMGSHLEAHYATLQERARLRRPAPEPTVPRVANAEDDFLF